jgi:hypothetical protein
MAFLATKIFVIATSILLAALFALPRAEPAEQVLGSPVEAKDGIKLSVLDEGIVEAGSATTAAGKSIADATDKDADRAIDSVIGHD